MGGYQSADGKWHGFLLSQGTYTTIDGPGATVTGATGINAAGDIVGHYVSEDGMDHGFLLASDHLG